MKAFLSCLIDPSMKVRAVMQRMSDVGRRELFLVDHDGKLEGSLSDGDIRKWILSGGDLNQEAGLVCNRSVKSVSQVYDLNAVKELLLAYRFGSVPVVDDQNRVVDVLFWNDVFEEHGHGPVEAVNIPVVIMAGGKGTRLAPFTHILPKPLIPIGDKPIIEIIMDKFKVHGIRQFYLLLNYKAAMIRSYFEEAGLPYELNYLEETDFLGTAGGLKILPAALETFLLTNCDVIIDFECADLLRFHQENRFALTLVVSYRHVVVPYGVCEIEQGGKLKTIKEKPEYNFLVNTGVYMVNREILSLIPKDGACQMDELIRLAKSKGLNVGTYPIQEKQWIDIGQWEEYHKAVKLLGM